MIDYHPPDLPLDIVHCDEAVLIVNKPAGLLSVPGRGAHLQDCMIARVQARFPDALTVHRLDMATSGLLVMARGADTHRALSRLFEQRQVEKRYIAVVEGRIEPESGTIELPLITDWPKRPRQKVDFDLGKPSKTAFHVLAYDAAADSTRVALAPHTGRSHQLRVHMQAIGHPILGDELYASEHVRALSPRLLLHAEYLCFRHPVSGTRLECFRAAPF